jgi:hypothetical protein
MDNKIRILKKFCGSEFEKKSSGFTTLVLQWRQFLMVMFCFRLRYGAGGSGLVPETALKRTAINNSLLDLVETSSNHHGYTSQDRPLRRGSVGSLGKQPYWGNSSTQLGSGTIYPGQCCGSEIRDPVLFYPLDPG